MSAVAQFDLHTQAALGQRRKIGLLAGWGRFPVLVAESLRRQNCEVYCLGVRGHADERLADVCDHFAWVGFARLGGAIRYYRRHGVQHVTMAGKVFKHLLFRPGMVLSMVPDLRTVRRFFAHFVLPRKDNKDDSLLLAVVDEFASGGIHFAPATDFAPELLVKPGQLTRRAPTAAELTDIRFGWQLAKEMARLDVGQSVAVKQRAVIAVEAIEGTDKCIERAGQICRGGFTVVKVAKPQQDMRFDVPTIGLGTLETMLAAGSRCLAVEAHRTIIIDQQELVRYADKHRMCIVALDGDDAQQNSSGHAPPGPTDAIGGLIGD